MKFSNQFCKQFIEKIEKYAETDVKISKQKIGM